MSPAPRDHWPPIISAAERPVWVRWRGYAVTSVMWGLLVLLLEKETEFALRALRRLTRQSVAPLNARFDTFIADLGPAIWAILLLVAILIVATLVSRRRSTRALLQPRPAPLSEAEMAAGLGLGAPALDALRRRKIVVLDVDAQGRVSVRPDGIREP